MTTSTPPVRDLILSHLVNGTERRRWTRRCKSLLAGSTTKEPLWKPVLTCGIFSSLNKQNSSRSLALTASVLQHSYFITALMVAGLAFWLDLDCLEEEPDAYPSSSLSRRGRGLVNVEWLEEQLSSSAGRARLGVRRFLLADIDAWTGELERTSEMWSIYRLWHPVCIVLPRPRFRSCFGGPD